MTRSHRWHVARLILAGALVLGAMATPARAQSDDEKKKPFQEPGIEYIAHRSGYIQWLAGALFIAACLAVAFKNPHRTHLD